jgi:hypothetical protein
MTTMKGLQCGQGLFGTFSRVFLLFQNMKSMLMSLCSQMALSARLVVLRSAKKILTVACQRNVEFIQDTRSAMASHSKGP